MGTLGGGLIHEKVVFGDAYARSKMRTHRILGHNGVRDRGMGTKGSRDGKAGIPIRKTAKRQPQRLAIDQLNAEPLRKLIDDDFVSPKEFARNAMIENVVMVIYEFQAV